MPRDQRYISRELTHLFGRKQSEKGDDPYATLRTILRSRTLSPHGKKIEYGFGLTVKGGPDFELSDNRMYNPDMVCFCDIPYNDLHIHMQKYGQFGISFQKDFVVNQGGTPVFYIPKNAFIPGFLTYNLKSHSKKDVYFNELIKAYRLLFFHLHMNYWGRHPSSSFELKLPPNNKEDVNYPQNFQQLIDNFPYLPNIIWNFLDWNIFSFIKFFDHTLPDNDENNYYFEREWRIIGFLRFKMKDVTRIIIPKHCAESFRKDFFDYCGELNFSENL